MFKKSLLLIGMLLFSASIVHADQVGNGGDGVMKDGVPYLLDLVEVGVELEPYFENTSYYNKKRARFIQNHTGISEEVSKLISAKLTELDTLAPEFVFMIIERIRELNWYIVDRSLKDIKDDDSAFDFNSDELVQIATRQAYRVTIDKNLWDIMTASNKCALIFHEVIFSLVRYASDKHNNRSTQNPLDARMLTSFIFSDKIENTLNQEFRENTLERHSIQGISAAYFLRESESPYIITHNRKYYMIVRHESVDIPETEKSYWNWTVFWRSVFRAYQRGGYEQDVPSFESRYQQNTFDYPDYYHYFSAGSSNVIFNDINSILVDDKYVEKMKRRQSFIIVYNERTYSFVPYENWIPKE